MVFQDLNKYGHEFTAAIKDCKGKYSTARDDSIAGAILRNIAYAADEDRIDNILLADARHKFELVDALKKESEDKYLHAMQQSGYLKT
jgi:hypothetical protein